MVVLHLEVRGDIRKKNTFSLDYVKLLLSLRQTLSSPRTITKNHHHSMASRPSALFMFVMGNQIFANTIPYIHKTKQIGTIRFSIANTSTSHVHFRFPIFTRWFLYDETSSSLNGICRTTSFLAENYENMFRQSQTSSINFINLSIYFKLCWFVTGYPMNQTYTGYNIWRIFFFIKAHHLVNIGLTLVK